MRPLVLVLVVLVSRLGYAQSSEDKAAANALFDEAKRLQAAGDLTAACPKFEASMRAMARLGVQLNLADCYEQAGRTASAWAEFRAAAAVAAKENDPREAFARQRAAALEPKIARLTVKVSSEAALPGLEITRDGKRLDPAFFDVPVPVDPGAHKIAAQATGRVAWTSEVTVDAAGTKVVEVPVLEVPGVKDPIVKKPLLKDPNEEDPIDEAPSNSRRTLGLIVAAGGGVVIAGGIVLGLVAKGSWGTAHDMCNANNECPPDALADIDSARSLGNVATVVFAVGLVAAGTGVVLFLTAPSDTSTTIGVGPLPGGGAVTFSGSF
jgi:hypothetical protein